MIWQASLLYVKPFGVKSNPIRDHKQHLTKQSSLVFSRTEFGQIRKQWWWIIFFAFWFVSEKLRSFCFGRKEEKMTSRKPMAHLLPTLYFHSTISHQRQLHQLHHCTPNCRNHNSITSLTAKTNNSTCQTIIEAGSDLDTERAPINAYTYLKNVHITVCLLNMVLISSKFLDFLLCILSYTQIHRAYN